MTKLLVATALVVSTPTAATAHPTWETFKHTHTDPVTIPQPEAPRRADLLEDVLYEDDLDAARRRWEAIDKRYDAMIREREAAVLSRDTSSPPLPTSSAPAVSAYAIPTYIVMCESGGNYLAENDSSTASGAYQIIDGSWAGYGGYSHASYAPSAVQDAKAAQMWADGAGASHWAGCL